jgi:hypothetical protein
MIYCRNVIYTAVACSVAVVDMIPIDEIVRIRTPCCYYCKYFNNPGKTGFDEWCGENCCEVSPLYYCSQFALEEVYANEWGVK